jgi:hypothetical protein
MFFKKPKVEALRELPEWGMRDLPSAIRVPAMPGRRAEDVEIAIEAATVDDLAFAILGIEAQVAQLRRPLCGLRELYDHARKRGGVGADTVAQVFFNESGKGAN